jgi:hypothetical protein
MIYCITNFVIHTRFLGGLNMIDSNKLSPTSVELIECTIEKQRMELTRIVEKHQYNFQSNEVIAASIEMDHWLNLYQQSCIQEKSKLKS